VSADLVAALTVPTGGGRATLGHVPLEPDSDHLALVETVAIGICGTDRAVADGHFGYPPVGESVLVIGHEAVGRIVRPGNSDMAVGQLVTSMVRRPVGPACDNCALGEWDMCRDGKFTEHGIAGAHGFARQMFRQDPTMLLPLPPGFDLIGILVEPTSVVAKAWEQIDLFTTRSKASRGSVLIIGAGPIGLLAAMLARQRGLQCHVADTLLSSRRSRILAQMGVTPHPTAASGLATQPDIVIEASGNPGAIEEVIAAYLPNSVTVLLGVCHRRTAPTADFAAINDDLVLTNRVVFGSVNANTRHYVTAIKALGAADPAVLDSLITRQVKLEDAACALTADGDDIKTAIVFPVTTTPKHVASSEGSVGSGNTRGRACRA
jgi:threonine dehydrogenase-like Zn-dependent dehydrogenase